MEGLLLTRTKENYQGNQVVIPGKGRDSLQVVMETTKWLESFPLFPDYTVWVEEVDQLPEETFELTFGLGISVTVWGNILITRSDGDTNPKSLSLEDFRQLKKELKLLPIPIEFHY